MRQRADERRVGIQCRHHMILPDTGFASEPGIGYAEFVEGLDVIGHERNRVDEDLVYAGASLLTDDVIDIGPQPLERPDAALIAERDMRPCQALAHQPGGLLDPALIRITLGDEALGDTVSR